MIKIIEEKGPLFWSMPELLMKTASFLSPKNIARLLTVSSQWYQHLGSNALWITLCPRISVENPSDHFYLTHYPDLAGVHLARSARMGHLKVLKSLYGTTCPIRWLQVLGETIIANSCDGKIHIWDRSICLQATSSLLNHEFRKAELDFPSPDYKYSFGIFNNLFIIAAAFDKDILVKDFFTDRMVCSLVGHTSKVTHLEVADKIIVSVSEDQTIRIWDETGSPQRILRGYQCDIHQGDLLCLQVIGKTIIAGSNNGTIFIWDQDIDLPLHTLQGHRSLVTDLMATDTIIVSGSVDRTICIWDRSTYTPQYILEDRLEGHTLSSLEIVDNIMILALDRSWRGLTLEPIMQIWDLSTGTLLHTIDLESAIWCLKFTDNTLIAGTKDGCVKIWGL